MSAPSRRRTGWITQLADEADGSRREFDRFLCHWRGEGPDGPRIRYGPVAVPLGEAVAWCAEHCRRTFLDGFGGRRWAIGRSARGFPALPSVRPVEPLAWAEHAAPPWRVTASLGLGVRDYADAQPGFEASLRAGGVEVAEVRCDDLAAQLHAVLGAVAPTEDLATRLAIEEVRRAATDRPDGLRDEQGDALDVRLG